MLLSFYSLTYEKANALTLDVDDPGSEMESSRGCITLYVQYPPGTGHILD